MSGDLSELMAKAQEAQQKLHALQQELTTRRVEGAAGGGMVKATVSGGMRVLAIDIEPALATSGDREMLQDLVAAAVNAALSNAQQMIQEEMQRASASFSIPIPTPGSE